MGDGGGVSARARGIMLTTLTCNTLIAGPVECEREARVEQRKAHWLCALVAVRAVRR